MTDKDFKTGNNYREVECCGNCKNRYPIADYEFCLLRKKGTFIYNTCDKWEHE